MPTTGEFGDRSQLPPPAAQIRSVPSHACVPRSGSRARYDLAVPGVDKLRAHAIAHSLFPATGLEHAVERLGFVQADPIRAPARAQDLILRQRVRDYRAGDLERRFGALDLEE